MQSHGGAGFSTNADNATLGLFCIALCRLWQYNSVQQFLKTLVSVPYFHLFNTLFERNFKPDKILNSSFRYFKTIKHSEFPLTPVGFIAPCTFYLGVPIFDIGPGKVQRFCISLFGHLTSYQSSNYDGSIFSFW